MQQSHIFIFLIWICTIVLSSKANAQTMDKANYPFELHYAEMTSGKKIAYFDEGSGDKTLLMIHGLGSYAPAWEKVIDSLKHHYRCIALDLPGYGKSSGGDFAYDMSFFADALEEFTTHLDLENIVLIGHSMGGQIAMTALLKKPELAEQLVLIAPAGFETFSEQDKTWFQTLMTPAAIAATPPERIRLNFAVNFHLMQFPSDAEFMYQDRLQMRDDSIAYQAYCEMIPKCVMGMLEAPVFDQLPDLDIRSLVIYGEGDLLIPNKILHPTLSTAQVAQSGVDQMPQASLSMIDNCGHFVQWECAEQVNELILKFLK